MRFVNALQIYTNHFNNSEFLLYTRSLQKLYFSEKERFDSSFFGGYKKSPVAIYPQQDLEINGDL